MYQARVRTDHTHGPPGALRAGRHDWTIEPMGNPKYPLELFQRVVTARRETQKIVAALPQLDI